MTAKILVTGATGNTGSALVGALRGQDIEVRAFVRDETKAKGLKDQGAEIYVGDLTKPDTIPGAFEGIDKAYLLTWNGEDAEAQGLAFVEAAKAAGGVHVVRHSARGHEESRLIKQHRVVENALRESGLPWTILRPTMFMQVTMMFADSIKSDGAFYAPLKDAKVAMIDVRDIVGCAVGVLTGSGHEGQTYRLTGPGGVSFGEVASTFSELLGKDVNYVDVPPQAAREAMQGMGCPPSWWKGTWNSTTASLKGCLPRPSTTSKSSPARPPTRSRSTLKPSRASTCSRQRQGTQHPRRSPGAGQLLHAPR